MNARRLIPMLLLLIGAAPASRPGAMSYLDNGVIRIGVNLDVGGAITHLSKAGEASENLVSNWDWGRQIQMSNYSGPVPFQPAGTELAPMWTGLGWNPVQAGDAFRHQSKILDHRNDGKAISVRCVPMQWPLKNVPAECVFETRITLERNTATVQCRLVNQRADRTQYPARDQELPAVYTIGKLHRIFSYTGEKPWTGGEVTRIAVNKAFPNGMPNWSNWLATEHWAALVNDDDFGVGVWNPQTIQFGGGFHGKPGAGGTHDDPTGYLSPNRPEILDADIVYDYAYVLIVGKLDEIRAEAVARSRQRVLPAWRFENDRRGWTYVNASDTGWPIRGELDVQFSGDDPQIIGPTSFWRAQDSPRLGIEAAFKTNGSPAVVYFRGFGDKTFSAQKCVSFDVRADGAYHTYDVDLSKSPGYRGEIVALRLDPATAGKAGDRVKIRSITLQKPR